MRHVRRSSRQDRRLSRQSADGYDVCTYHSSTNNAQSVVAYAQLDRRWTNILAISKNFRRRLRLNPHPRGAEILYFLQSNVRATIDQPKEPQQLQLAERPHKADIEQSIVHLRLVG